MNFIILIYTIYQFTLCFGLKIPSEGKRLSFHDLAQCRICQELFAYDFNYDLYLKDQEATSRVEEFLNRQKTAKQIVSSDNFSQEAYSKDLALKYFLKSNDNLWDDGKKFCKKVAFNSNKECDSIKSNICDVLFSNDNSKCEDILSEKTVELKSNINLNTNANTTRASNSNNSSNNSNETGNLNQNMIEDMLKQENSLDTFAPLINKARNNMNLNSSLGRRFSQDVYGSNMNEEKKLLQLSSMLNMENEQLLRGKGIYKGNNQINNESIQSSSKASSLLEISPEISSVAAHSSDITNQRTFQPKPVIFDNFENNLGSQLKDISFLTK